VAEVEGVDIHAPRDGFISYFNSPYYAHQRATALDIYTLNRDCNVAFSPVAGRVMKIHSFMPPGRAFLQQHYPEQLIILASKNLQPRFIRLLHINSAVKVGDDIAVGDKLGTLIRSGFFNYWTDPHIHVDIRRRGNLLRAKGSLLLTPRPIHLPISRLSDPLPSSGPDLTIVQVKREYILAKTTNALQINGVYGFDGKVNTTLGLLDAGLPHYSYGGIHFNKSIHVAPGSSIRIGSQVVGTVMHTTPHYAMFQARSLNIYLNGQRVRGLSLYLYLNNHRLLKIIPLTPGALLVKKGDSAQLSFQPSPPPESRSPRG
jgi:hypothetical protein